MLLLGLKLLHKQIPQHPITRADGNNTKRKHHQMASRKNVQHRGVNWPTSLGPNPAQTENLSSRSNPAQTRKLI